MLSCSSQFLHSSQANVLPYILELAQPSVYMMRNAVEAINVAMLVVAACAWIEYQVRSKHERNCKTIIRQHNRTSDGIAIVTNFLRFYERRNQQKITRSRDCHAIYVIRTVS